jgi:hypothetical protein
MIGFLFTSNDETTAPGWAIDDVILQTDCPFIDHPAGPVNVTISSPGHVCVPLPILYADSVTVTNGNWANDTLCFVADSLGAYQFHVVATNNICKDSCDLIVNVSGVKVGDEIVAAGGTVAVPIKLSTSQALAGYTIPLQFSTTQPGKVHLDSVRIDPLLADSAFIVDSTHFIVYRPMQLPPLPPDTASPYTVAEAYFSVAADAQAEVILIDTATMIYNSKIYTYQFIDTLGTAYVPLFVPGSITIKVDCVCGDFDCDGEVTIADVVYLIAHIFTGGPAPRDVSRGDVDCSGSLNIADTVYLIQYIFIYDSPAPCAGPLCSLLGKLEKHDAGSAEIWLETEYVGDSSVITVAFKSPVSIAGLQIELASSANEEFKITDLSGGMAVYAGQQGANRKIGMLDITGHRPIPAGESRALRLSMKSGPSVWITDVILVGTDARQLSVVVRENRSMTTLPDRFDLAQNCPNPFNPTTQIRYSMPVAGQVHLEVLNVLGQHVATLVDGNRPAGVHQTAWEGIDDQGQSVASGVYFYRLRTDSFTQTRRMVLLK